MVECITYPPSPPPHPHPKKKEKTWIDWWHFRRLCLISLWVQNSYGCKKCKCVRDGRWFKREYTVTVVQRLALQTFSWTLRPIKKTAQHLVCQSAQGRLWQRTVQLYSPQRPTFCVLCVRVEAGVEHWKACWWYDQVCCNRQKHIPTDMNQDTSKNLQPGEIPRSTSFYSDSAKNSRTTKESRQKHQNHISIPESTTN